MGKTTSADQYYVPHGTNWPIIGSIGLFITFVGFGNFLHGSGIGGTISLVGISIVFFMLFGWFKTVIDESHLGYYNNQVDKSFRLGMAWFIFSEVMFFAAFFGALYYARIFSIPWLGGEGAGLFNQVIWPDFKVAWPLLSYPDNSLFSVPTGIVNAWDIPLLNTLLLLSSGATITWAHWGLKENKRNHLIWGMVSTVLLGLLFLYFQVAEYGHAYSALNLKLDSGIYGSTFFLLTGFHGFHVTMGTFMLIIILLRCLKGHFTNENHFAFEAVAWYWHFVDVVWIGLFIFVYWI